MEITAVEMWIFLGIVFILSEFTFIPGIGLLFVGLGALTTSTLIYYIPELPLPQIAIVGIISFIWFLCLWWPLKKFLKGKSKAGPNYFDIVGMQVEVIDMDIEPNSLGRVSWSGTTMNARLKGADIGHGVKVGEKLYVLEVKGNVLICARELNNK
jgi:membrane protein implicated in regulation of membrane protease activity